MTDPHWIKDPIVTIRKSFNQLNEVDKDQLISNRCDDWRFEEDDFYLVNVNAVTGPAADLELMSDALHSDEPLLPIERDIHKLKADKQFYRGYSIIIGGASVIGMPLVCKTAFKESAASPKTPILNHTFEGMMIGITLLALAGERKLIQNFFKTKKELAEKKIIAPDIKTGLQEIVADRINLYAKDCEANEDYAPI
jgi:hypothetical protein